MSSTETSCCALRRRRRAVARLPPNHRSVPRPALQPVDERAEIVVDDLSPQSTGAGRRNAFLAQSDGFQEIEIRPLDVIRSPPLAGLPGLRSVQDSEARLKVGVSQSQVSMTPGGSYSL